MADIKNYGLKGVGSDVQYGKSGGRLIYDSSSSFFKFTEADGSTLAQLRVATTPSNANDVASKSYVDATINGLDVKGSVRAATTAAGTLATDFENGDTLDGVTLVTGDRILLKNQADASENGVYTVNASGAPTRATDFDADSEVTAGAFFFVEEGTTNGDAGFLVTSDDAITVGTDDIVFTQFSGSGQITAGDGMTKSGNTLNVVGGDGIVANADDIAVDIATDSALAIVGGKLDVTIDLSDTTNDVTGTLAVGSGGTGQTSLDDVVAGSNKVAVTNGSGVLIGGGSNLSLDIAEANLDLANMGGSLDVSSQVTGTLAVANGGTGATSLDDIVAGSNKVTITDGADAVIGGNVTVDIAEANLDLANMGGSLDVSSQVTGALAVANGGTGATDAATARTNLGLAIGSDVQAYDAQLDDIAGLTPTDGNIIVGDGTNFVTESGATARTSLGLGTGDTPTFAGVTTSANIDLQSTDGTDGSFIVGLNTPTSDFHAATKKYVDDSVGSVSQTFAGDSGSGTTTLGTQTFTFAGTSNEVETSVSGQTVTIGLVDNPTMTGNVTVTGNLTVQGTTTTVDSTTVQIQNAFVFEGATDDAFETTLTTVDPTADRTISLPDASGTIVLADSTDTLTNKTIAFGSNTFSGQLAVANGGTGQSSLDGVLAGSNLLTVTNGTGVLIGGGSDLTIDFNEANANLANIGGSLDVSSQVTGTLALANGGTGADLSSIAQGTILVGGASNDISQVTLGTANKFLKSTGTTVSYDYVNALRDSTNGNVVIEADTANVADNTKLQISNSSANVVVKAVDPDDATANVNLVLESQGSGGRVLIRDNSGGASIVIGDDDTSLTVSGGVSSSSDAGDLVLKGGNGTGGNNSGDVLIKGGTGGAAEGKVKITDSSDNEIAIFERTASAVNEVTITNAAASGNPEIAATGDDTNISIALTPKGSGLIVVPDGYEGNVGSNDDALVTRAWVLNNVVTATDDLILRASITNGNGTETVGTMPNAAGITYYVTRIMINVSSGYSGGSIDSMLIDDGTTTLASVDESDVTTTGSYIIDLDAATATAGGATITVRFKQSDGTTAATPTAGAMTVAVEYKAAS
jgi:hypothetical protein